MSYDLTADATRLARTTRPLGKRSFSSQVEKLLLRYEQRNLMLMEKEANIRTRVEMMEAAMPVLLAWNMYQNCVEETESEESQVTACPVWFSDQNQQQQQEKTKAESESDLHNRKEELDRLIREIRRREKLDRGMDGRDGGNADNALRDHVTANDSSNNNSKAMSRDLVEIQEIRKEKAVVEKIIKSYQKRSEELREKEEVLMKKMESVERGQYTWKNMVQDPEKQNEYIVCDPLYELTKTVDPAEECKECILRLREEVLKKQYENLQLEKELQMKKEEHRRLKIECEQPECIDFGLEAPHFHGDRTDWTGETIEVMETKSTEEEVMGLWERFGSLFERCFHQ